MEGKKTEILVKDYDDLKEAKSLLEYPSLTARVANFIGKPIEFGMKQLPIKWNESIGNATKAALLKGLEYSIYTMGKKESNKSSNWFHKLMVFTTGSVGGAFGLLSLPIELPLSTCIILRSIADIAKSEGHDIESLEIRLDCLQVLALGSDKKNDNSGEHGYWFTRVVMARQISSIATYIAEKGLAEESAPPIVKLISVIAARFSSVVTEEAIAKAIPAFSALTGGGINYLFMSHFQDMARGHFIIKRLENKYGMDFIRDTYNNIIP